MSLFVIGVVLFFCLSYLPALYKKNRLDIVTDQVKSAIQIAKTQALITGDILVLSHLPGTKDWSDGMLLFVDNPQHKYTVNAKLLYEWHWQSTRVNVTWHGFQSDEFLLFASDIRRSTTNGYFVIKNATQQARLIINRLGRVRAIVEHV